MDSLTISAASGMRSRLESLDLLANNLANTTTPGFKIDRESYNLYVAPEAVSPEAPDPTTLPVVERHWTDFGQGHLTATGNSLDFALTTPGFFAANGPGSTLYTRNGSFRLSTAGILTTADGYPVRAVGGGTIQLDANQPFEATSDGTIMQAGTQVGQLEIDDFAHPEALDKFGKTYFVAGTAAGARAAANVDVRQGDLEASNVEAPETAVRLVGLMRQFEMLQKAVHLGQEMGRKAIEEVAKV